MNAENKNKGISLIEILVVVAIISIITLLMIPNILTARLKSRDAKRKIELKQIQMALEMYKKDNNNNYPPTQPSGSDIGKVSSTNKYLQDKLYPYYPKFPLDPADPIYYFHYEANGGGYPYLLCTYLEYDGDSDKSTNARGWGGLWTVCGGDYASPATYKFCSYCMTPP